MVVYMFSFNSTVLVSYVKPRMLNVANANDTTSATSTRENNQSVRELDRMLETIIHYSRYGKLSHTNVCHREY